VFIRRPDPGILGSINHRTCERVFLKLLDTMTAEGQPVSPNSTARNYAPRIFVRKTIPVEREGYTLKDLEQAMRCLIKDKRIFSEGYGRRSNEHYRLRRVAGTSEEAARHHSASH
jgi:hypothetical protein